MFQTFGQLETRLARRTTSGKFASQLTERLEQTSFDGTGNGIIVTPELYVTIVIFIQVSWLNQRFWYKLVEINLYNSSRTSLASFA